jgi:hypothetical protein
MAPASPRWGVMGIGLAGALGPEAGGELVHQLQGAGTLLGVEAFPALLERDKDAPDTAFRREDRHDGAGGRLYDHGDASS